MPLISPNCKLDFNVNGPAGHFDRTPAPHDRVTRWLLWLGPLVGLILLAAAGCDSASRMRADSRFFVKPTVAVISFQAASVPMGWRVGDGLADVLTDELVRSERFHVVERPELGAVLSELQLSSSPVTRAQGKPQPGRLKNVEYLIKGKITDFGHVSSNDFAARMDALNWFGNRHSAIIRMTFYVVEVESGQIVASKTVQSSIRSGSGGMDATYKNVGFGGAMFYRTPLGKVTASATRKAVAEIVQAVATRPWQPRIAMVRGQEVILNGGSDRDIKAGSYYRVYENGDLIVDPATGDVLGRLPGQQIGQLEVTQVFDRYSLARPMAHGDYRIGQHLAPATATRQEASVR